MMLSILIALILVFQPTPLHIEADATRSEYVRGDTITIDAYLFDGGDTTIGIVGPAGFEIVQADAIAPGHARFQYKVLPSAPKGLATFVVVALDGEDRRVASAAVVVRVGPLEWPPPRRSVYVPVAKK